MRNVLLSGVGGQGTILAGNILAQGNGNHIGCRITADDVVKVEKTASGTSAYVYCLAKAA